MHVEFEDSFESKVRLAPRSAEEVVRACNMVSTTDPSRHWVFDHFVARTHPVPARYQGDFIGTIMPAHFVEGSWTREVDSEQPANYPKVDHEYFEWTDLLEAVLDAGTQFTMVELGAGFGRWSARGALAARRRGLERARAVLVEGDPVHVEWLHEYMRLNGITNYTVFEGAAATRTETALFVIDVPEGFFNRPGRTNPAAWYGQSLARSANLGDAKRTFEMYKGRNVWKVGGDWKAIEISTFSLAEILVGNDQVDLIDIDIQGAEGEVIEGALGLLTKRVRRLFIETHSHEVERQIRVNLQAAGWRCLRDYPLQTTARTPFGQINFGGGGLQSWINPRLYMS